MAEPLSYEPKIETGGGHSTQESVDGLLVNELDGRMIIDVVDFAERFVFPEQGSAENKRLDFLVEAVDRRLSLEGISCWTPQSWLDVAYLPWFTTLTRNICKEALATLRSKSMESVVAGVDGLHLDETDKAGVDLDETDKAGRERGTKDEIWANYLKAREWASKSRVVMTGGVSRRSVDIILSASPENPVAWPSALVLGEHKSTDVDTVAAIQLAGYVSDAFGTQSFRHVFHGFTIMPNGMRLWRFDRSGGLSSTVFSFATDDTDPAVRQRFIKIILAYTVMDDVKLGFDPDVFGDSACTKPCHYTAGLDANNCWAPYGLHKYPEFYVRIVHSGGESSSVYRLLQRLFIRPGIASRGTVCFRALNQDGEQCIVKFLWRYTSMTAEGLLLESVEQMQGVCGVVRMLCYDEKQTIQNGRGGIMSGVYLDLNTTNEEHTHFLDPLPDRVFTRTVLKDVGLPLESIERPLDLVKTILGAFIGE
ncbi:MAG: hypothetical protein M1840_007855 [Geoglossum simile]|nr:MAG: hypothetical protein M1840_007855 [Geoglossum simile]